MNHRDIIFFGATIGPVAITILVLGWRASPLGTVIGGTMGGLMLLFTTLNWLGAARAQENIRQMKLARRDSERT